MIPLSEALLLLVLLATFAVLAASRITFTIRATAFQGLLLGALPLVLHHPWTAAGAALAGGTLVVKAVVLPAVLLWALREAAVRREVEPSLGPLGSIAAGVVALALALAVGRRLPALDPAIPRLLPATALTTLMCGLVVLTTRRKAMMQVVGYLLLENGIYLFGLVLAGHVPLLVEMGVLLDLFVGVFIMGLVVFHMNRELESLDSANLAELHD
ncbi:MAG TPA: hydrogenase [Candidatus Eisenbacteria bacterium]|nr:hydrogenase [Candidatus Eisenbacteria bacterium]